MSDGTLDLSPLTRNGGTAAGRTSQSGFRPLARPEENRTKGIGARHVSLRLWGIVMVNTMGDACVRVHALLSVVNFCSLYTAASEESL